MNKTTDKTLNKSEILLEGYYKKTFDNGLTVVVYPMPDKSSVYALYGAKIGSVDRMFKLDGKKIEVPAGIAHFLEHKLFESEKGDAFTLFAKTGASANAFTSFDKTCYLFSASANQLESLSSLIEFVNEPYFTKETVEKEQGIIGQEIKMYLDAAPWVMLFGLLQSLYVNHTVRDDIAGTVETIADITKDTLFECYEAYYRPENMVLAVAGNIDPESVFELVESKKDIIKTFDSKVEYLGVDEPNEILRNKFEQKLDISSPMFCLGFKEKPMYGEKQEIKKSIAIEIILDIIAGETSELFRELYDNGIINGPLSTEAIEGRGFLCTTFSSESEDPYKAIQLIKKEIEKFKKQGIDEQRFLETKRALIGDTIIDFDSVEEVATNLVYSHFKGVSAFDYLEQAKDISLEYTEKVLKEILIDEFSATAVVLPKQEKGV